MTRVNLLLPIAGKAQRFLDEGYNMAKPLIMVNDRHLIDWSLSSIKHDDCNLIFVVRDDHIYNFSIDKILVNKFGPDIKIVSTDGITEGAANSCLLAEEYIDNDSPLVIYTPDIYFRDQFDPYSVDSSLDGLLVTFKSNSPAHSYAEVDHMGRVVRTAEKVVISPQAAVGVYYFKHGRDYVRHAKEMIRRDIRINNEFYICPVYNQLVEDGQHVGISEAEKVHILGTPSDMTFFVSNVLNSFGGKPLGLCADHSGLDLKQESMECLKEAGIDYLDFGTYTDRDCDYSDYLNMVARAILDGRCDFGLGFCRTGQGINMAANKITGLRSALVFDEYTAEYAVRHNCANFFSIPTKYVDKALLARMIDIWKLTTFDGGRHKTRIDKFEVDPNFRTTG